MNTPMQYTLKDGTAQLTSEQASALFTPEDLAKGEKRGEIKVYPGMWQQPKSYIALAVDEHSQTIYGYRSLTNLQALGYDLEGRVSIAGKKLRGFTSSLLFQFPDGTLFDCAIIYICSSQKEG